MERTQSKRLNPVDWWPSFKPDVAEDDHGWLFAENEALIQSMVSKDTRCIVELGSWLGRSTRCLLDSAPGATLLAVDHWMGGPDHQGPEGVSNEKLSTLFETFLVNCWGYRERLIPLRMPTVVGLDFIHWCGYRPNLIYIDADHSYAAVREDIRKSLTLFPGATVIGDDWTWGPDKPVQRAVRELSAELGFEFRVHENCAWVYEPADH
jgi:hypothetical protein